MVLVIDVLFVRFSLYADFWLELADLLADKGRRGEKY